MVARVTNKFSLRMGAQNIFDKSPPLVGSEVGTSVYYNGNTFPQIYELAGPLHVRRRYGRLLSLGHIAENYGGPLAARRFFFARTPDCNWVKEALALEEQADSAAAAGQFALARSLLEQAVQTGQESVALWTKLSSMRKAAGDLQGALAALDRTLALNPLDFPALLGRALILDRLGDPTAGPAFGNALALTPLEDEVPEAMKAAVGHARQKWGEHQARLEARLTNAVPTEVSAFERQKLGRFISNYSRRTRHYHQDPSDFHYPGLPEIEFHDVALFPELVRLEAQAAEIRGEFSALIAAECAQVVPYTQYPDRVPLRQWKELNNNPKWSAISSPAKRELHRGQCASLPDYHGCARAASATACDRRFTQRDVLAACAAYPHPCPHRRRQHAARLSPAAYRSFELRISGGRKCARMARR